MMTETQLRILVLLSRGYSVKGIADEVGYTINGIYPHVRAIRETLGVETDAGAVVEGLRLGLIEMPEQNEMVGWVV